MSSLDLFKLDGRVALVTGGSKGLGLAMARALAGAGADLVLVSRHLDEAEAAAETLASETGVKTLALAHDVSSREQVEEMTRRAIETFGKIDILINNAGINIRKPTLEMSEEEWREVMEINLTAPFLCSKIIGKGMVERRYGRIVMICSMMSFVTLPGRAPYASSKAGLVGLTRTLALEWAPYGVTVNGLCPGPFETPLNRVLMDDPVAYQAFLAKIPLGRWGQPEELGGVILFLASDASSYMTGSTITIDGGWTAQ